MDSLRLMAFSAFNIGVSTPGLDSGIFIQFLNADEREREKMHDAQSVQRDDSLQNEKKSKAELRRCALLGASREANQ